MIAIVTLACHTASAHLAGINLLFKTLPSQEMLRQTFQGIGDQLGGAFAGLYRCDLIVFTIRSSGVLVSLPPVPTASVWHLSGQLLTILERHSNRWTKGFLILPATLPVNSGGQFRLTIPPNLSKRRHQIPNSGD